MSGTLPPGPPPAGPSAAGEQPTSPPHRPLRWARIWRVFAGTALVVGLPVGWLVVRPGDSGTAIVLAWIVLAAVVLAVLVGSILSVPRRTREWGLGLLFAGGVVLLATAGFCVTILNRPPA